MPLSTIKKEFAETYVAFGKGSENIGQREDIDELAIIALQSQDKNLLSLFDKLPSIEELQKQKTDLQLKSAPKPETKQAAAGGPTSTDTK